MTEALGFPIIDAHHHFWDPVLNYYPWLCDSDRPPHRYGDHQSIAHPYLPAVYLSDTAAFKLAGSVYIEADWDPRDPVGEMRYIAGLRQQSGWPTVAVGKAWLDQPDAQRTLEQLAAFGFVRGIRHKPRANDAPADTAAGGMADPAWRHNYGLLARHGLHFELQTPFWHLHEAAALARDFPDTPLIINHTGMPSDRSSEGLAAWREAMRRVAQHPNVCQAQRHRAERAALDRGGKPPRGAAKHRAVRRRPLHVWQQLPGRQPLRLVRRYLQRLRAHGRGSVGFRAAPAVSRQRTAPVPNGLLINGRSGAPACCRAVRAKSLSPRATGLFLARDDAQVGHGNRQLYRQDGDQAVVGIVLRHVERHH